MKVILLNPPGTNKRITRDMAGGLGFAAGRRVILPPVGLAYLAASLRDKGCLVKIIDLQLENFNIKEELKKLTTFNPDVVIGEVSLPTLNTDANFLKTLKKDSKARIIAKTAITFAPILEEILQRSKAQLCIFGEHDLDIYEIITDDKTDGTVYLKNGKLIVVSPSKTIEELDLLPLPARDILPNEKYSYPLLEGPCTIMQTSRGCPFPCAYYCPYPLVQGKKWRAMSSERVYRELEDIVCNLGIRNVLFRDACFTFNRQRVVETCNLIIQKKLQFNWWCETRIDDVDVELLKLMKKAGCQGMNIGVETGDPELFRAEAKRGAELEQLQNLKNIASCEGVKLHFLLLIGLSKETRNSHYLTFKLIRELQPESLGVTIVTPYPGTPLYYEAKEKGWIETEDWRRYSGDLAVMHTDNLSSLDMSFARKMIEIGAFFVKKEGLIGKAGIKFWDLVFRIWAGRGEVKSDV